MESLITAITALLAMVNKLTPLALVALLIGVLYVQLYKQPSKLELSVVRDNHLHELPEVASNMREAAKTLQRIEVSMEKNFATLIEGQK